MDNSKIVFIFVGVFGLCSGAFSGFAFVPIHNGVIWCMAVGAIVALGSSFIAFTIFEGESSGTRQDFSPKPEAFPGCTSPPPPRARTLSPKVAPIVTLNFLPWSGNQISAAGVLNIPNLLSELQRLPLPQGRRLVLTQLILESLLAEPLEVILREKRSVNDAVLRGVASRTDLIPCARVSSTVTKDEFWKFVTKQYHDVVIVAPEGERNLWLSLFVVPEIAAVKSPITAPVMSSGTASGASVFSSPPHSASPLMGESAAEN